MTKTNNGRLVVVPSSWIVYDIGELTLDKLQEVGMSVEQTHVPGVAVMEALVAVGQIKRVVVLHTFNALPDDDDEGESDDSPFYSGGPDES